MRNTLATSFAVILAALPCFAGSIESEAVKSGKGVLVLQCGSDWCVSGESVREEMESAAFRRSKVGSQFIVKIYDEMEKPTDAVKAKNAEVSDILVRTKRFPTITCYAPVDNELRIFAQIENVSANVTGAALAENIGKIVEGRKRAEAIFKKAALANKPEDQANLYGQGFDVLWSLMCLSHTKNKDLMLAPCREHFKELSTGKCAWRKEWDALTKLDAGDRYGWLAHFDLDEKKTVAKVLDLTEAKEKSPDKAKAMVDKAKALPQAHLNANQKQWVKVMEYALTQTGTDKPLASGQGQPNEKQMMNDVFALGRDTIWGQFAMGRLMLDGSKDIESRGMKRNKERGKVRPRKDTDPRATQSFPLDQAKSKILLIKPGAKLTEPQKTDIARYAALRLIGPQGWEKLTSRPGSAKFVKAFLNDRTWMEDFAWSGTFPANSSDAWCKAGTDAGDGANAILALETLIYQDNGKWVEFSDGAFEDNEGRRFMTALAIVYPDKSEEWLADVLDAYRTTALSGRLHKSAYEQPVWLWRFAVHQGHGTGGSDNMAEQHRFLDKYMNRPAREYGDNCWEIPYRLKNCFGDSVHGPWYYRPWSKAGEWPQRKFSPIVGGVCGELSKFGSAVANAHGMPSTTAGQPAHCAYTYRRPDGVWKIGNYVGAPTSLHMCFWNKHEWQYTPAMEGTFSGDREERLGAERQITLAYLAEEAGKDGKIIEAFYQRACAAKKNHYGAWRAYGDWLMRAKVPLKDLRVWVRGCARGMGSTIGRQPLWDILTPYFERVAKENGVQALKDDFIEFAPLLRQSELAKIEEESNFGTVLEKWSEALGSDKQVRYEVLKAMLEAQYGTADYFSQTMGWGSDFFTKDAKGSVIFTKCLNEAIAAKTKDGKGGEDGKMDFSGMILAASRNGNVAAFRNIVKLQEKFSPAKRSEGQSYPLKDFGGDLLSKDGLLQTSSSCGHDHPNMYPFAIDDSPCNGGAFHTDSEEHPWAAVKLAGPTDVKGVLIENRFGGINAGRQIPIEVEISDDGETWQHVFSSTTQQDTYRVDLRGMSNHARYVRVSRKKGARKDFFHLNKILVYGTKLY